MRGLLTALGLIFGLSWAIAQSSIALNYLAAIGDCELDTDRDGIADGWLFYHTFGDRSWSQVGVTPSLSRVIRFSGTYSQQLTISRTTGEAGRVVLEARPFDTSNVPYFAPPEGTPLLVRARVQTENLVGVQARILVHTGERTQVLVDALPSNTGGWQTISAVVPLERANSGELRFYFTLELSLPSGAASGRVWVDAVEVSWLQFPTPSRSRPNMLKIAHINQPVPHWQMLLSPPVDFLIADPFLVTALRSYLRDTPLAIYIDPSQTQSSPLWNDLYGGYNYVLQNRPEWFLTRQGAPFSNATSFWPLNIGLPEVRQRAIQRLNEMNQNFPLPEWLYFDNFGAWWQCDQYPTYASILPQWTGVAQTVLAHVRQQLGRKVIYNAGAHAGSFLDGNEGINWIQYADGVVLEHNVTYLGGNPRTYRYRDYRYNRASVYHTDSSWWATLRAVNAYPEKRWILLMMADPNYDLAMFRYALASYFIMAHSNTYLMIEARASDNPNKYYLWVNRPEVWIPLGNPTGSWRVAAGTVADASGALFARDFEYGIVLVNPTEQQSYDFTLPRAYKNWDGQVVPAGTRITIGPKTGLAFYAAPEIKLSITPQQVTALPGETVTFTVQYRNDGLADATNVQVSVPLPEGLVFVSGSSGAQFANGRVSWTLPQVSAGASGTLTFQARVQ